MKKFPLIFIISFIISPFVYSQDSEIPDPNQGLRADWMRGSLGMLWLPAFSSNGNIEGISIEPFLNQIAHLKTVDYIQLPLTNPNIYSPVHVGPHPILESLWEGDRDANGFPTNLIVPRATVDDPLLSWLKAVKAAGLRTEIYVNSYNLLAINETIPSSYPDISTRWEEYCNTDPTVQSFLNSQTYHSDDEHERRPYMFAYAELILKDYAIRYGDLIDAWCFDSADNIMEGGCGDDPSSGVIEDQRIYQAFADACHAGNPNAAISFNNSVGFAARPFVNPTLFDDYTFGHPFGGAGDMVETESLYNRNFGICEYMNTHNGLPFLTRDDIDWNDNVVGHFFPKQSTTSWNDGPTPCLTDEEFVEWNKVGLINGGAITWGTPLILTNLNNVNIQANLILQPYALTQFELLEEELMLLQYPGAPNFARADTVLSEAYFGTPYTHTLTEGIDIWDPEGDEITNVSLINQPTWLTIEENETDGLWILSGIPTESIATEYEFTIQISDASGSRERTVTLNVNEEEIVTSETTTVQIQAEENTNYGVDNIATMISEIQTAPNGLATYQISIKVTPSEAKAIISGESGGDSTNKSFAVGTTNNDALFTGSNEDWIDNISDIEIINFNANGSDLNLEDISASFQSLNIVNAQSTNDNVSLKFGDLTMIYGKTNTNSFDLALEPLTAGVSVNEFSIGTGNTSTTNKWSIEGVNVTVKFNTETAILSNNNDKILNTSNTINTIILYPNPSTNTITFNRSPKEIHIYDISGKLLKSDISKAISTDISELNTGIYIVKFLSEENEVFFKRLLKKE